MTLKERFRRWTAQGFDHLTPAAMAKEQPEQSNKTVDDNSIHVEINMNKAAKENALDSETELSTDDAGMESEGASADGLSEQGPDGPSSEADEAAQESSNQSLIEELREAANDARDKHLRLLAEFENFRRRSAKESVALRQTAARDLITDLLPVLDDFDRALKAKQESQEADAEDEGFRLIAEKFRGVLERRELQPMNCLGLAFDPEEHEAITEIPAPSPEQKGTVLDVVEEGYRLGETIIRYAKVVVGK